MQSPHANGIGLRPISLRSVSANAATRTAYGRGLSGKPSRTRAVYLVYDVAGFADREPLSVKLDRLGHTYVQRRVWRSRNAVVLKVVHPRCGLIDHLGINRLALVKQRPPCATLVLSGLDPHETTDVRHAFCRRVLGRDWWRSNDLVRGPAVDLRHWLVVVQEGDVLIAFTLQRLEHRLYVFRYFRIDEQLGRLGWYLD